MNAAFELKYVLEAFGTLTDMSNLPSLHKQLHRSIVKAAYYGLHAIFLLGSDLLWP